MMATGLLLASWLLSLTQAGVELVQTESFQPTQSSVLGYIALEDEMHFEMDVVVHSCPSGGYYNFFHCGSSNSIRMPGIWLYQDSCTEGADQAGFRMHVPSAPGSVGGALVVGDTYHIEIEYTQSLLSVTINGESVYSDSKSQHTTYDSIEVYGSDPWYNAADVTISNLLIRSGVITTDVPSSMPTTEPTKNCELLHIDEFLLDCSSEWDNAENLMSTMQASVDANAAAIVTGTTSITANAADISTNAADIASFTSSATTNTASITSLESKVAELEDILDQLSMNSAAANSVLTYPLQGDNVGMMDEMWNGVTLTGKDLGIVVLAAINVMMIMCMVIACKRSGGRTKYHVVAVGSDIEPMNA